MSSLAETLRRPENVAILFLLSVALYIAWQQSIGNTLEFSGGHSGEGGGEGSGAGSGTPEDGEMCAVLSCHNMATTLVGGMALCDEHRPK